MSFRTHWRIGELAKAAGITVRTLHHYEQIGLLAAPARTSGRQRRYDARDVQQLYRVRALRDLGLSLADVRRTLKHDRSALAEVLRAHRAQLDSELERLRRLRGLLDHACRQADRGVAAHDLLVTIEAMSRVAKRSDAPANPAAWWRSLGARLRACLNAKLPVQAPRVRALARAAQGRLVAFAGGDPKTLAALSHLRRSAPPDQLAGWTPELMRYLDDALSALPEQENT